MGFIYARLEQNEVKASGTGGVANLGYHWKWPFGLGIMLGAGASHVGKVEASSGFRRIEREGGTSFNLEAGIHYMFF